MNFPNLHSGEQAFQRGEYGAALGEMVPLARKGNATAQYYLARMFHEGKGVPEDNAIAFRWGHRAAQKGNADGECLVGILYAQGQGTPKDLTEAASWFHKAAHKGNGLAQCKLGLCYLHGAGVVRDSIAAYAWFELAASNSAGHDQMCNRDLRDTIAARNLTAAEIEEARRRARELAPNFIERLFHVA